MQSAVHVDSILNVYTTTENAELEIRFDSNQLKRDWYMTLLNTTIKRGTPVFEQSINLMSNIQGGYTAHRIEFVNGVKQEKTTKYTKRVVARTNKFTGMVPYRLVLATEIPTTSAGTPNMVRIKLRLSIHKYPGLDDWRIDFTFTKEIKVIKSQIVNYKDKMFVKYDMEKFIDQAPWQHADKYELEVEHIGKTKTGLTESSVQDVVGIIHKIISPDHEQMAEYQNAIYEVAKLMFAPQRAELFRMRFGLKKLFNSVKEINRSGYFSDIFPKIQQFYATIKADGTRVAGHVSQKTLNIIGQDLKTIELSNALKGDLVVDAELVNGKLMIFDVMVINGISIMQKPFSDRIKYINDAVMMLDKHAVPKKYIKLTNTWDTDLKSIWEKKYSHEVDGIIFNSESGTYSKMEVWKWKPIDKESADFMALIPPPELLGKHPHVSISGHTLMILFCSMGASQFASSHIRKIPYYNKMFPNRSNNDVSPMQFSTPDNPIAYIYQHPDNSKISAETLNRRIGEFNYADEKWVLMRIREDKDVDVKRGTYFGNNYHIAMIIWNNFNNPLTFTDLISPTPDKMGYFIKHDSGAHKSIRSFHSFIKYKVMESTFKKAQWLVDLAAGKGQDMFRISKLNITNAVLIDIDKEALSRISHKMFSHKKTVGRFNTRIFTKQMDLSKPYLDNVKKLTMIPREGVSSVMCNFALHYFMATKASACNIINMVNAVIGNGSNMRTGGSFMFVGLNGRKVFDLLQKKKAGEQVDFVDNGVTKFSIKRLYSSDQFMEVGQKIGITLPFSDNQYYEEYLVNIDYIIGIFRNMGYTVTTNKGFDYWLDTIAIENTKLFARMTDVDKKYTSLHQAVVVNKIIRSKKQINRHEEKKLLEQGLGKFTQLSMGLPQMHNSRLAPKWFELIKQRKKTVEGRLDKGTFAKVNPGDVIEFTKSGTDDKLRVKVTDILKYPTFEDMFGLNGEQIDAALPGIESATKAVALYHKIYEPNMVKKHGTVAVHIDLI